MAEMLRASKRIIVVTEGVNGYHFRALVDGIDLSFYDKNPIMLWMHNRAFGQRDNVILPLGNVVELKREHLPEVGYCLTGLPVFDGTDDFAVSIYNKYENGTIRMASAGLIPVEWSEDSALLLPGQRRATLVKSVLEEVSIVDIGADPNAVSIVLYSDKHQLIELLADDDNAIIPLLKKSKTEIEMSKIELTAERAAVLLGLKAIPVATEIESKIAEVVQLAASQKAQIETLSREKTEAEQKVKDLEAAAFKERATVLLNAAVAERKISQDEVGFYAEQMTDQVGYDRVKVHLESKAANPTIKEVIGMAAGKAGKWDGKTWADLDSTGQLAALKAENITLFKALYEAQFSKAYKD